MPSAQLAPDAAAFYAAQSTFSDPGVLAPLYDELPADPARLARITRDLMIHRLEGDVFRYEIPATGCTTTPRPATSTTSCGSSRRGTTRR
ncbi:hypothetical protein NKH77_23495 [Streptomyces sp. M19]